MRFNKLILLFIASVLPSIIHGQAADSEIDLRSRKEEAIKEINHLLTYAKDTTNLLSIEQWVIADLEEKKQLLDTLTQDLRREIANIEFYIGCAYHSLNDERNIFRWFMRAAQLEQARAQYNIGVSFEYGYLGQEIDLDKAIHWYTKAAEQHESGALLNLGALYYHGKGVEQNCQKAFDYLMESGNAGNAEALGNIGTMYNKGKCFKRDAQKAISYFLQAAEAGAYKYYTYIGQLYHTGDGVKRNRKQALHYFHQASERHHPEGICHEAACYYNGDGTKKDYDKAFQLVTSLEPEKRTGIGCALLGECYRLGRGIEKDIRKAAYWYNQAFIKGYEPALKEIKKLQKRKEISKEDFEKNPEENNN